MSPRHRGKRITVLGNAIALRAGRYLDDHFSGSNRNKRIAQWGECSPEMAKVLRRGEGWTVARLQAAAQTFGWAFVAYVFEGVPAPVEPYTRSPELEDLHARLARLEEANGQNAPHASMADRSEIGAKTSEAQALGEISPRQGRLVGSVPASHGIRRLDR